MTDRNLRGSTIQQTKRLRRECLPSDDFLQKDPRLTPVEETEVSLDTMKVECFTTEDDANIILVKTEAENSVFQEAEMIATTSYYNLDDDSVKSTLEKDVDEEDSEFDSTKQLFLRRQPRRFAHSKTFSNGVADRATADWLKENFQTKRGSLVPKGFLCDRYEEFCQTTGRKPMNNATLGRFIRGVFRGLETRRLGARQQSRYFYNNLDVRPSSNFVQLMMQDRRPSYIRRHRIRSGQKMRVEEDRHLDTPTDRAPLVVPAYLQNFRQRRMETSRLVFAELHGEESMDSIQNRLDSDGYQILLATATQNEIRILQICEEIDSESKFWFEKLTQKNEKPRGIEDINLVGFFTDFSIHLKVFCRSLLIFDLDEIPVLMKKFWLENEESLVDFQEKTNTKFIKQNLEEIISWQPMQNLINQIYLKYYSKFLDALLPDDSNSTVSLNEYVCSVLQIISLNYEDLIEFVTTRFPEAFRLLMLRGACAFCADLRERLNWNYSVTYIRQITNNDRLNDMIKKVFFDDFDSAFTADFLFSRIENRNIFEESLQRFFQFGPEKNVPDSWVKWFFQLVQTKITEEKNDLAKNLKKLEKIRSDWIISFSFIHDNIPPFEGNAHIMGGVFDFFIRAVSRVINKLTENLTQKTSVEGYAEKFCMNENFSSNSEPRNVPMQWWPDFLQAVIQSKAQPIQETLPETKSESLDRNVTNIANVVVEVEIEEQIREDPSSSGNSHKGTVRVSGRTGKGRNRWLDFGKS